MTEKICPFMSRPKGFYPAKTKEVKICHHCDQLMRVDISAGIQPLVWHDEYPCQKEKCMAWTEYELLCGSDQPAHTRDPKRMYGYCRLIGNEDAP
jgi:hypothetical protein